MIKNIEIINNNILKLFFNNWEIRYIDIYFFFDNKVKTNEVKKINYSIAVWDYDICPDLVYNYSFSDIDFLIQKKELAYEIINKTKNNNLFIIFKPNLEIYIKELKYIDLQIESFSKDELEDLKNSKSIIESIEKIKSILYK